MDDARLQHLHTNNQLRAFATIIMRRQWFVPDQPFNRLYKHLDRSVSFDEVSEFLHQDIENTQLEDIYNEVDKLFDKEIEQKHSEGKYPYEVMLFKLYLEHGSTRKVQAVTGIPYRSIARTIAGLRERLKERIGKEI